MRKTFALFLIFSSLFFLPSEDNTKQTNSSVGQYFQKCEVENYAESITVRVFPANRNNDIGGSGVLVHRTENQYTVVTNYHVIDKSDRLYHIQTSDSKIYNGKIVYAPQSDQDNDVAFLVFTTSDNVYPVATLEPNLNLEQETSVIAGGFPFGNNLKQSQTFQITEGTIAKILERPFIGGYQIGYTNTVIRGMSGGPLLNCQRELIGINGMGQYPLFGNPYTFEDGSTIADSQWQDFSKLSWAVPVEIITRLRNVD